MYGSRTSSSSPSPSNNNNNAMLDNNKTRVWIRASALESLKHPKIHRLALKQTPLPAGTPIPIKRTFSNATSTTVASESGSGSSGNSGGTDSLLLLDVGRNKQWGWRRGTMVGNTHKGVDVVLDEHDDEDYHDDDDDDLVGQVLTLAPNALDANLVVLANDTTDIPQDLITLTHLHEPAVVYSLQQRYAQDLIYTSTGPVLLALNPFCTIRGLYGEAQMRKYADANTNGNSKLPPHVYQIAYASYKSMMRQLEDDATTSTANQSILVSGESGAGKTVTTKFVMKFLAALSQRGFSKSGGATTPKRAYLQVQEKRRLKSTTTEESTSTTSISTNSIEGQVLQSNPILEAFGNARTVRNDNSSRFGKFIEIQFQRQGKLVGASIDTYLLEKVRLVTQSAGERNYHVFYQLLGAMSSKQLRQYYLAPTATPADFLLTCRSSTFDRRDGVTDKETFSELTCAMAAMKFLDEEQVQIFSLTASFLHLSNLEFLEDADSDSSSHLDPNNVHLTPVCKLLGVTPEALNQALCTCAISVAGDAVYKSLSKQKAEKGLEALIKATYGSLFTYLVRRINDSIAYKPNDYEEEQQSSCCAATIGVLDIFGFESFTTNSFEQLCINYCNEALQQQFNAFCLKNEQEEYEREGIQWSFIQFVENKDVLELMEGKTRGCAGMLRLLDDHCRAPGTTDKSFCSDVYSKFTGHARFLANRSQVASLQFQVLHYAGPVEYTALGFVEKNRDELPKQSMELLLGSSNGFVMHMAEVLMEEQQQSDAAMNNNSSSRSLNAVVKRSSETSSSRRTVGGQFRRQLKELRQKIDLTSPHYIRCLKPNDFLVPHHFDALIVAEQLRCGGILEAIKVSRAGFTQHYPHEDFVRRYRGLATTTTTSGSSSGGTNGVSKVGASWNGRSSWGSPSAPQVPQRQKPPSKWQVGPNGAYRTSAGSSTNGSSPGRKFYQQQQSTVKQVDYKSECTRILKILSRKIQAESDMKPTPATASPPAKAKTYKSSSPSSIPSWRRGGGSSPSTPPITRHKFPLEAPKSAPASSRYQPWSSSSRNNNNREAPPPPRRFGSSSTSTDLIKVGIQVGKTKVFLRHAVFEILERLRSKLFVESATKLNAVFRMHLCRIAYLPIRNAFRQEVKGYRSSIIAAASPQRSSPSRGSPRGSPRTFSASTFSLIEQFESQVRSSIHASTTKSSRSEWGKQGPSKEAASFKWMLQDGLWVRNPSFVE